MHRGFRWGGGRGNLAFSNTKTRCPPKTLCAFPHHTQWHSMCCFAMHFGWMGSLRSIPTFESMQMQMQNVTKANVQRVYLHNIHDWYTTSCTRPLFCNRSKGNATKKVNAEQIETKKKKKKVQIDRQSEGKAQKSIQWHVRFSAHIHFDSRCKWSSRRTNFVCLYERPEIRGCPPTIS